MVRRNEEMEETKPVHEIIEEVKANICDHYCKYTAGFIDANDETFAELVNQYCVDCPLNRL
jgi:hypothetical protein